MPLSKTVLNKTDLSKTWGETWGKTRGLQSSLLDHETHTTLSYDDTYIHTGLGVWNAPFFREAFPAFQVHLLACPMFCCFLGSTFGNHVW